MPEIGKVQPMIATAISQPTLCLKGDQNSSFPRHRKSTDHLYLRGNIYYFRYAFPKKLKEKFGQAEIRLSLKTGFLYEARRQAKYLWNYIQDFLMPDQERTINELKEFLAKQLREKLGELPTVYASKHPEPDLVHPENTEFFKMLGKAEQDAPFPPDEYVTLSQLKEYITRELEKLYPACIEYAPPEISVIKQHMDRLRQLYMEAIDNSLYEVGNEFFINNEQGPLHCSVPLWLDQEYLLYLRPLTNNPRKLLRAYFPGIIQELVEKGLFTSSNFTADSVLIILNEYNKVLISINRIHLQRDRGDFTYEKQYESYTPVPIISNHSLSAQSSRKQLLLSEFIAIFIDTKIKDGKWEKRVVPVHKNRIDVLLDVLGDIPVTDIDRTKMRYFRDVLIKLPPNRTKDKRYKNKSVNEIIKLNPDKTLSIGTVDVTLTTISGMFEWGIKEGLIDKNPAKDLGIPDPEQNIDKKDALTEEDIHSIFFSGDYKLDCFKNPAYYWVPLIALYTGMRLEEICQLHTEDIYQEDGIWLVDIRLESTDGLKDKILKNKNAARKIPIHKHLIDLGLIKYIEGISKNSQRAFPLLNKTEKSPKYGKQVGKQFAYLLKKKGITGKKSFHSLRHSFSNYFKKLNLHTDLFTQIMGHKQERLASDRYGSRFGIKQCYEELISKIYWE